MYRFHENEHKLASLYDHHASLPRLKLTEDVISELEERMFAAFAAYRLDIVSKLIYNQEIDVPLTGRINVPLVERQEDAFCEALSRSHEISLENLRDLPRMLDINATWTYETIFAVLDTIIEHNEVPDHQLALQYYRDLDRAKMLRTKFANEILRSADKFDICVVWPRDSPKDIDVVDIDPNQRASLEQRAYQNISKIGNLIR